MASRGRKRPSQHFLQSPRSRTYPLLDIARLTEEQAEELFRKARWPDTDGAPVCPFCGHQEHWYLANQRRYKCKAPKCRKMYSVTVGTPFAHHKLSFTNILIGIRAFTAENKGRSAIAISHELDCDYKTAFAFAQKVREALKLGLDGFKLQGTLEIDGAYFGGHVRPENVKVNRVDRHLSENRTGKRRVVVGIRERGPNGRVVVSVHEQEHQARAWAVERVARDAVIMADEGVGWLELHASHEVRQVNHDQRYVGPGGTHTNHMESFFSRLRRFEVGTHHHIAGPYLLLYAADAAWRENNRRRDHRTRARDVLGAVMAAPQSRTFTGYWQRRRTPEPDGGDFFAAFA